MKRSDVNIRDPFVIVDKPNQRYVMTGTKGKGYNVLTSPDLENWVGPFNAFTPQPGFWAENEWWAPEIHEYKGSYYLFGSIHSSKRRRGTQIFKSSSPMGPFAPISTYPVTPAEWESLDGSLYLDKKGNPWMVFCHEWVQIKIGEVCAIPLSADLTHAIGAPKLLFRASDARWAAQNPNCMVTDGCFMHRMPNGHLIMLWSSFTAEGYCLAVAHSLSGEITGPWIQERWPIDNHDGGHGMLFTDLKGNLMLAMHRPNTGGHERAVFLPIIEQGNRIIIAR